MPSPPPPPVRLSIVGLGAMGTEMLEAAAAIPDDVTVVQAFDLDPGAAGWVVADRLGAGRAGSAQELVESPDIDAVYVAVPPASHADVVVPALRAGKAVFCEKPLAVTPDDGRRMVAAAAETGLVNAVNFALSDRDAVLEIERSLLAGEVGEARGVEVRLSFPRWPRAFQADATWLAGADQGGFVREVASHFVYLTDRLLGPITPVDVGVDRPVDDPNAGETAAHGLLRIGEIPVLVSGFVGIAGPELYEWTLWGSARSYRLRDWGELSVHDGDGWQPVTLPGPHGSEATRLHLFADAVRGADVPHLPTFADARRVQSVIEAFHRDAGAS